MLTIQVHSERDAICIIIQCTIYRIHVDNSCDELLIDYGALGFGLGLRSDSTHYRIFVRIFVALA